MLSVTFDGVNEMAYRLAEYERDQIERVKLACAETARYLETYAILNHPWEVLTGATNVTTKGTWAQVADGIFEVALSAGMFYDKFLEAGARQYPVLQGLGGVQQTPWSWIWPAVVENADAIGEIFARHLRH